MSSTAPGSDADRLTPKPGPSPWLFVLFGILALGCMAGAIIMPILASAGKNVSDTQCQANLRSLAIAAEMYAGENDDRMPIKGWDNTLHKFQDDDLVFACPVQRRLDPRSSGYALSSEVAGKERSSIEKIEETVMLFDSTATQPGIVDQPTAVPKPGRHGPSGSSNNAVYMDGRVRAVKTD